MNKFAFFAYLLNSAQIKRLYPLSRFLPKTIFNYTLRNRSFEFLPIQVSGPACEKQVSGYFIFKAFVPGSAPDEEQMVDDIIAASKLAAIHGARILGLGAGLNRAADTLSLSTLNKIKLPLTTGDALTAWSAYEAVYRTARTRKMDLGSCAVAILGAANALGSLCARKFAFSSPKVILCDDTERRQKLETLKQAIHHLNHIEVAIESDLNNASKEADALIITDADLLDGEAQKLSHKSQAIICNALGYRSGDKKMNLAGEAVYLNAGLIKAPFDTDLKLYENLEDGILPADLAETMLLASEGRWANYSLGENINLDKMEEIADISMRQGFQIWVPEAPLF